MTDAIGASLLADPHRMRMPVTALDGRQHLSMITHIWVSHDESEGCQKASKGPLGLKHSRVAGQLSGPDVLFVVLVRILYGVATRMVTPGNLHEGVS